MESITALNPASTAWDTWANTAALDLQARYTMPNPGVEGLWQLWATELLYIPGLAELGLPSPAAFGTDWRAWAAAFLMATT